MPGGRKVTHGGSYTRLYLIWIGMKSRCHCRTAEVYKEYGGRGITVCAEWRNDFLAFAGWAVEAGYADGLQIDRIDNDKGYSAKNCRWVSRLQNCRNKRNNRYLEAFGESKILSAWTEDTRCVVPKGTLTRRVWQGWPLEAALTTPSIALSERRWGNKVPL